MSPALFALRLASPTIVVLATLALFARKTPVVPTHSNGSSDFTPQSATRTIPRRSLITGLLALTSLTYLAEGLIFVVLAVVYKIWPSRSGIDISAFIGIFAFCNLAIVGGWKAANGIDVWALQRTKAGVGLSLLFDVVQVVLLGTELSRGGGIDPAIYYISVTAFRLLLLVSLLASMSFPRTVPIDKSTASAETSESAALLGATPTNGASYGTFHGGPTGSEESESTATAAPSQDGDAQPKPADEDSDENKDKDDDKDPLEGEQTWLENWRRFRRLTPYLWPSKSRTLQVFVVICILLVLLSRLLNIAVPLLLAKLVAIFEHGQQDKQSFWPYLLAYVGVQFLRDGGIRLVREALWNRVAQYSEREIGLLTYKHLLSLSYGFHSNRKTGEVLSAIDRGEEVNRTLETVLFTFMPNVVDLFASIFVITATLDWTIAVIMVAEMTLYAVVSSVLNKWLTKKRRDYIDLADKSRTMYTDCLINYETVKYFNGEQHELERWRETFLESQNAYMRLDIGWNLFSLVQTLITSLGLLVSSMIISHRVAQGILLPSDFVFFIMYIGQLYGPLNIIGWMYQMTNSSLINTEKLLRILNEPTEINDKPGAPDLVVTDGEIEFDNVSFSYDKSGKTNALKGMSFKVPKGSSVALVGESGAGKSTVFKLLYRFYDIPPDCGRITIDGQDIRDVTQDSLRRSIGVVPQEAVLFNGTVGYNIGYGKLGASQAEIEGAAKAAQMHERVLGFKNGYETKVGERGIRLSGGEKQRVAIARTILKSPPILLLDEATSALDTSTEREIQKALQNLVKGRTSISIAHRLSTIASADIILVFKNGEIVERGNHRELLKMNGVFASMWADQIHAAEAETEAEPKEEEK